jgi:SAM-dependent methyltransferase
MDKKVFETYSQYYDLLYKDKDYTAETNYIISLIKEYNINTNHILELGCGTGMHASILAENGYNVEGIDLSQTMLDMAIERKNKSSITVSERLSFSKGDIRNYESLQKFDTIISLFHVISYMTKNEDLNQAFNTVAKHLKSDGIFIFDCWHGPGVIQDKPVERTKHFENEKIQITRVAKPVLYPETNCVDVNFDISILNKHTNTIEKLDEIHSMRYLFMEELNSVANNYDLEIINAEEWLTKKSLTEQSWNACYVCKNKH